MSNLLAKKIDAAINNAAAKAAGYEFRKATLINEMAEGFKEEYVGKIRGPGAHVLAVGLVGEIENDAYEMLHQAAEKAAGQPIERGSYDIPPDTLHRAFEALLPEIGPRYLKIIAVKAASIKNSHPPDVEHTNERGHRHMLPGEAEIESEKNKPKPHPTAKQVLEAEGKRYSSVETDVALEDAKQTAAEAKKRQQRPGGKKARKEKAKRKRPAGMVRK